MVSTVTLRAAISAFVAFIYFLVISSLSPVVLADGAVSRTYQNETAVQTSWRGWFRNQFNAVASQRKVFERAMYEACRRAGTVTKQLKRKGGRNNDPSRKGHVELGMFDDVEHPAHQLIARAGRRMARSCRVVLASDEDSFNGIDDSMEYDNRSCPLVPPSALEVRGPRDVAEVTRPAQPAFIRAKIRRVLHGEPFMGMILQVLPAGFDDARIESRGIAESSMNHPRHEPPGRGEYDAADKSLACITRREELERLGSDGDLVQYELLELMHTELGLFHMHILDYAYRPVISVLQQQQWNRQQRQTTRRTAANIENGWTFSSGQLALADARSEEYVHSVGKEEEGDGWNLLNFSWVLFFFGYWNKKPPVKDEGVYERMGERAFAGGSHGEVWRARRRCERSFFSNSAKGSEEGEESHSPCDDQQDLIMKRLKIEHGFDLLQAGLREVYFGELLAREAEPSSLFTKYVDHFYRKSPPPPLRGSALGSDAELWIVFENAGPSLRSYLYTAEESGDFIVYQHSSFWRRLRMSVAGNIKSTSSSLVAVVTERPAHVVSSSPEEIDRDSNQSHSGEKSRQGQQKWDAGNESGLPEGKILMMEVLRQVLTSAAYLHNRGIVHRDIKPSNIMCKTHGESVKQKRVTELDPVSSVECVLGDFSSAYDEFTSRNLYENGPSAAEQTDEYAPPEVLFGPTWVPFHQQKPQSYDSWSIGVLALELLLGTPNVFSVDQRTTVLLTNRMKKAGASAEDIERALYLAALSQFCIYVPTTEAGRSWPLRAGDPLHDAAIFKPTCTLNDFHHALRARDPLGIGFDSSTDPLLQLIWGLLAWDPMERLAPSEALQHAYFKSHDLSPGKHNALESQLLDPRMDMNLSDSEITEFFCPKCGKVFGDLSSCQRHTTSRRHAKFCTYDRSLLPSCLNAHSMLPAHPTSGYCDIQGRRRVIEDFHTVHLHPTHQFYGIFDGHRGNLASKFAASSFHEQLAERFSDLDGDVKNDPKWKDEVKQEMADAFDNLHKSFMHVVSQSPGGVMDQSGTTATVLYVTDEAVLIANIGDSRAILSRDASYNPSDRQASAVQLTVDHVASDSVERKLIQERGGFVSAAGGIDRVNGILAVSRSIGDQDLASVLSRSPHVMAMTRADVKEQCRHLVEVEDSGAQFPCFVVLASDGLWDVMSNQEAVDMVVQVVRKFDPNGGISWEEGGAFQEAAQALTQEAYVRGSTDNIGVCVVAIT